MGRVLQLHQAGDAVDPCAFPAPPPMSFEPFRMAEVRAIVHAGESDSDACERLLAHASRFQGAVEVAIGEGLLALQRGDRLIALGFSRMKDYAREVLDVSERTAQDLVRVTRELRGRPLLRAAVLAGEVRFRSAQTVLPVAVGEAEERWVAKARVETVRALEAAVRQEVAPGEPDEEWGRLVVGLSPEERATVDEALAVAGKVLPGSSRFERLEAMAQEYVGEHPLEAGDDLATVRPGAFRRECRHADRLERRLERETERWSYLERPPDVPAPSLGLDELATAEEIDGRVRELAALRDAWSDVLGFCAFMVRRTGLWYTAGFASFDHYCKERLGLSARAVEQRASLERRLWEVPALRAARDAGLPYEKVRLLSRLPDAEIAPWVSRARALTCVELRAALADRDEGQMRAARVLRVRVPARVAILLQSAFRAVEAVEGRPLSGGRCLVRVAEHFLETWRPCVKRARTASQKVRERDLGRCQVPGCSRRAVHAHHVDPRSRGGSDELGNLVAVCAVHHLRGIHGGHLRVRGSAPDGLVWEVGPVHDPVDLRSRCTSLRPRAAAEARAA